MILCQVQSVKKEFSGTMIFEELSLTIKEQERLGLVGRNGCGKSTLLKLISGEEEADEGVITKQKECTVGSLAQIPSVSKEMSGKEFLKQAFREELLIQEKMTELEALLSQEKDGESLSLLVEQYGALQEEFELKNGYELSSKIDAVTNGLKIDHLLARTFSEMSGGEQTKLGLALLLLQKPDLLLLDEPTNHLDLHSIEWLEQFIQHYSGAVVIISHDRYFLDKTVTSIADLEDGELTVYSCSYTEFTKRKEEKLLQEFHAYEEQQKKIKKMKEAIKRLRQWANEANPPNEKLFRKAKSMERALAKIERLKKPVLEAKKMNLAFTSGERSGKDVIEFGQVTKGYDELLFKQVSFSLFHQDRMAVIGDNGTGKSTLFRLILGMEKTNSGTVKIGRSCRIGYLSQDALQFEKSDRVIDLFRKDLEMTEPEARHVLATFLFYGADVFNKVSGLSGGERMRLRLAILMHQPCNVLLLDEPTNHLDIESREVLEDALREFNGTILAISHDRYFLNQLFTKIAWLENQNLTVFEGSYEWAKEKREEKSIQKKEIRRNKEGIKNASTPEKAPPISEEISEEEWMLKLDELEKKLEELDQQLIEEKSIEELQRLYQERESAEQAYHDWYNLLS
ncbi:ribosomal protection-like ABC-F family protein [Jeotgalibacillus proteolyticus]|uniref:ribosomal protection-like ABC-F family protein n=1 Tax=Jeotgalibacillus proteolyticus TaxID=2082395 RepID=UPI003CF5321E